MHYLDEYSSFDAVRFCKDYPTKKKKLADLIAQRESLAEGRGATPTDSIRVQTSHSGDGIFNIVDARERIAVRIADLQDYFEAFDRAYNSLTDGEKEIIDKFFIRCDPPPSIVYFYADKGISQSDVYRLRRRALDKIKSCLFWT